MENGKTSAWIRESVLETSISCMQERYTFYAIKHLIFITLLGQQRNHLILILCWTFNLIKMGLTC